MNGSFHLGRLAGIEIDINSSWLIAIVLITFSFANGWFPALYPHATFGTYLLLGFIAAILLFISVLLHELAHSLVARMRGLQVKSITLFIFGGVSNIEQEPQSAGSEFQMAFVGPLVSLLLGLVCYLLLLPFGGTTNPVTATLIVLMIANITLGVFNLIPGFPLDGGRVLRSIVWKITGNPTTATRVATFVGEAIAYLFILFGIWEVFSSSVVNGIWLGFIGWFMLSAAQAVRARATLEATFGDATVEQVMNRQPMTVPANISVQRLVDDFFLPQGLRSALVLQGDQLAGLVTLSDIRHVAREQWGQTPVGLIMIPAERLHTVAPTQKLRDALPLMTAQDINQLPVVQDGRLVGVINRDAIMRSLQLRNALGIQQRTS